MKNMKKKYFIKMPSKYVDMDENDMEYGGRGMTGWAVGAIVCCLASNGSMFGGMALRDKLGDEYRDLITIASLASMVVFMFGAIYCTGKVTLAPERPVPEVSMESVESVGPIFPPM